jgi:sec-independent protein translocase protein TatB
MNFFGLGIGEILLILLIVLVVVGPERLPGLARQTGLLIARVQSWLQRSPDAMMIMQARKELEKEIDNLRGELVRMQQAQAQLVSSAKQGLTEIKESVEQPFTELKTVASSSATNGGGRASAANAVAEAGSDATSEPATPQIELTTPDPDAPEFAVPEAPTPVQATAEPAPTAPPAVASSAQPGVAPAEEPVALPSSSAQIDALAQRLNEIGAVLVALQDELRRQGVLTEGWQPRSDDHAINGTALAANEPLDVPTTVQR